MKEFLHPNRHATTQAADGLPRLKWTLAEFERLSELGFFGGIDGERERVELIDGEIIPMQEKGGRHEWVREYWVVDARLLVTKVHSGPGTTGYASNLKVAPSQMLRPALLPALHLSLGSLGID